ncbi:MAG: translational machinery protein [Hyphomicrobium sp.]
MTAHYHAIVWIDHREARVFHFNVSDVDTLVLHAHNPKKHLHHKGNTIGSGHAGVDHAFLGEVAEALADAGAVLITGPGSAKTDLKKHIESHMPALHKKIAGVETADHPSDGELVAHARKYFKADHQLPPRVI